jgi:hypothetical protein
MDKVKEKLERLKQKKEEAEQEAEQKEVEKQEALRRCEQVSYESTQVSLDYRN